MKKQKKLHSFIEEMVLALCTIIMLVPIYYLVLGAFKDRKDIIKYPLLLTKELFTLENFPYVINKMKYWQALANTSRSRRWSSSSSARRWPALPSPGSAASFSAATTACSSR